MQGYALGNDATATTVLRMGEINLDGNVIPHSWYDHLRYPNGKPNLNAIIILAEVVYWYRPIVLKDEKTGRVLPARKKFEGEHLQRTRKSFAEQFGLTTKQVKDALNFLEEKKVVKVIIAKSLKIANGKKLGNVPYIALDAEKIAEFNRPLVPVSPSLGTCKSEGLVPVSPTNTETTYTENTNRTTLRANDARTEPPQASLFGTAEPLPVEKVSLPKKPPVSRPFYDAIFTVFGAVEAYNGLIQKAMEGRISKRHAGHEANFTIPATPEETLAFGEWWEKKYPDATPPLALDKIQNHFEAFRRERAAAEQAKQPKTRVRNGRVLKYDPDMKQWFDIGPEKENVPHENDTAQAEQRGERKAPAVEHGGRGGANWLAAD